MSDHMYTGLCVGGPLAGQRRTCESRTMLVHPEPDALALISQAAVPSGPTTIESFVYQHVASYYATDGGEESIIKFWVPATEQHPRLFAMQEMVRVYESIPR